MNAIKGIFNTLADPRLFFILAVASLVVLVWNREKFASNSVGYGAMGVLAIFFIFGSFDPNFRLIVTKPDNIPIVAMLILVIFFTWLGLREAFKNDKLIEEGKEDEIPNEMWK